jgi:hypothetical protein
MGAQIIHFFLIEDLPEFYAELSRKNLASSFSLG